ncbi:unnamed protein product, partial [Nesidiocoris tenuis]
MNCLEASAGEESAHINFYCKRSSLDVVRYHPKIRNKGAKTDDSRWPGVIEYLYIRNIDLASSKVLLTSVETSEHEGEVFFIITLSQTCRVMFFLSYVPVTSN